MRTHNLFRVVLVLSCLLGGVQPALAQPSALSFLSLSLPLDSLGSNLGMSATAASSSSSTESSEKGLFPAFQFGPASIDSGLVRQSVAPDLQSARMMGSLFQQTVRTWFDEVGLGTVESLSSVPMVMSVQANGMGTYSDMGGRSIAEIPQDFWQCSPKTGNTPKTQSRNGRFQVWLRGCEVAEFPTKAEADQFSKRIRQVLKTPGVDLSKLQPGFEDNAPAGKWGDKVLFVVTPELAQALDRNSELLAIEWINHLRVALGQTDLELGTAQAKMYGLEDTSQALDGVASWYGPYFHGRITATGEVYNQYALTAASRTLPFDTYVRVTNRKNGKTVVVRINDRGPYVDEHLRILDLSYRAATCLGSDETGIVPIDAVILKPAPGSPLRIGQKVIGVTL